MSLPKLGHPIPPAEQASSLVRQMIHMAAQDAGQSEQAMRRIASSYGISSAALDHLRKRKAKSIEAGLFARIRHAYLDLMERQVAKLQHQIATEKAKGGADDLDVLATEAAALAARIQARKAQVT